MATFRDDQIGVFFGWLNKSFVHWFNRAQILVMDRLNAPTAFLDIAEYPAEDAYIRISINKDFDIKHIAEVLVG
ncbi:hypothetical protein D3C71_1389440 [compost metagenome]